jgi:SAM-dependent methyltransferase
VSSTKQLEKLRSAELALVKLYFSGSPKVLEIGGGNGWQASIMQGWGCCVSSIDIAGGPTKTEPHFPVATYDGKQIPFGANEFDLVFSSNVLEHVADLTSLLSEIARVVKQKGVAIHILPTPTWRLFTSIAHYPFLVAYLLNRKTSYGLEVSSASDIVKKRGLMHLIKRIFFAAPHGVQKSAASELYYFSASRWRRVFRDNGFIVERDYPTGIFYTGYGLAPRMGFRLRRLFGKALGSSCRIWIVRKVSFVPDVL